jgi:membrane fusion protein (multidrug efflux system)
VVARHHETTDNAYVAGNIVQITPQLSGTVRAINADDTDFVKAGQPLVVLDPADARSALDQAEAELGQTVREVRTLYANNASLAAAVALREADFVRAGSELERAQTDLQRRDGLTTTGAVSGEELKHAQTAVATARSAQAAAHAAVVAAREQLGANRALTDGTDVAHHPNVERAAAKVREAYLALSRTTLEAPISGQVAKRSVQVGSRVAAGTPLMSLIALDQLWVDANFKESQLRSMRIGQPVTLSADLYGHRVEYTGRVVGLSAGTGAAFALLPAQNATGNWIKVVQRVPVRIALDPQQLATHPLRVGLSMEADVDVHDQSGAALASTPRSGTVATAPAPTRVDTEAAALVDSIVAANLGKGVGTRSESVVRAPATSRAPAPTPATYLSSAAPAR